MTSAREEARQELWGGSTRWRSLSDWRIGVCINQSNILEPPSLHVHASWPTIGCATIKYSLF